LKHERRLGSTPGGVICSRFQRLLELHVLIKHIDSSVTAQDCQRGERPLATIGSIWLGPGTQLRLDLLSGENGLLRFELRRWIQRGGTWRLDRKRGLRFERSELAVVLKALEAGERQ